MNWSTVKLIFFREARDQCRDRRTLFMLLVLPILLYPALGFGLIQLTLRFGQEERRVGVVGVEQAIESPPLFDGAGESYHESLFENPRNQRLYRIVPDDEWTEADVRAKKIDALLVFADDFRERLNGDSQATLKVLYNSADDNSLHAYLASVEILQRWGEKIAEKRLEGIGKPADFARPLDIDAGKTDVSSVEERSGSVWGKVFPFVLVIMALTGAFYPAVDLCAGEKERGTMETLLITPASRGEIVLGKFFTILSLSVASTVLNLASMGVTFGQVSRLIPQQSGRAAEAFSAPTLDAIFWMFVLMLPLAAFFSALCMALAVFARSTKEGQYYMMPMFLVVTPLVFLTLAPGVQLDLFYSLVPVTNVALLLRAFMLNQYELAMTYFLPVLLPTALYGYLALRFAVDQFRREEVLFREAERFELRHWLRHLLRDKEPLPTAMQAWSLYVLMVMMNWYLNVLMPPSLTGMAAAQLVVIGFLPAVFALLFTTRPTVSLSLRMPRPTPTVIALLLVFVLHPVVVNAGLFAQRLFPVPEQIQLALEQLLSGVSLSQKLLVLALIPAVCEEVAFRGFILRGLRRRYSTNAAIVISSVLFGVMHMISAQMLIATLLGIVLGFVLTRTGSLFPGMVFHAMHNSMAVLYGERVKGLQEAGKLTDPLHAGYPSWAFALSAVLCIGLLAALVSRPVALSNRDVL